MRALIIAIAVAVSSPCHAAPWSFGAGGQKSSAVAGFNFGYQIHGGDAVGLLQAFDDGKRIYFQFRDLDLKQAPQVWSEDSAGRRHALAVEATTPYIVSRSMERKLVFVFGKGKATKEASVVRVSPDLPGPTATLMTEPEHARRDLGAADAPPLARQCSGTNEVSSLSKIINIPFWLDSVAPTKRAQDDLKAFVARIVATGKDITIRGRPSKADDLAAARARADSLRSLLLRYGLPAAKITVSSEPDPKPGNEGIFYSEITYGASSSGFVLLAGC